MSQIGKALGFGVDDDNFSRGTFQKVLSQFPSTQEGLLTGIDRFSTGRSFLDPRSGGISIDPTGRQLNLGALSRFQTGLGQTRESLVGQQGAFQEAQVRPLLERLETGRAGLQRELGRTGVRGTFRDRALTDFDIAAGRAEGDARALAQQRALTNIAAIDQALLTGETGVAQNIFNQELAGLGLSVNTVENLKNIAANILSGTASTVSGGIQTATESQIRGGENLLRGIGTAATAFSSKEFKDDHGLFEGSIVDKLEKLDIHKWNYKGEDEMHIGPFAEEFNAMIGKESQQIALVDVMGVLLLAAKELIHEVRHG